MKIGIFHVPSRQKALQDQINEISLFKGTYTSLVALETAIPVGEAGWSADVDTGVGEDVARYIWDVNDVKWVLQKGVSTSETASSIKTKYESNANTNAYTDSEKSKLAGIENGADKTITSVTTAPFIDDITEDSFFGYVHVVGEVYTMAKTAWSNLKSKFKAYFDTIYEAKNNNIQSHISDSDIHVTTTDKSNWDGKQESLGYTPENVSNKENSTIDTSTTKYPTVNLLKTGLDTKMTNPMTAAGDIIYGGASGLPTRLPKGDDGQVLKLASGLPTWANESGGGGGTSLWTAITATRTGDRTVTVTGDQTAKFKKGMPIRWKEGGVQKWAMVSIASTYSTVTTITFIGCVCASIDEGSFYYSPIIGFKEFEKEFNVAGTIGATGANVAREFYPMETYYVVGLEFQVGSAGTTGNVTIDCNVDGVSVFSTKPTLGASSAYSTTPFTCNSATIITIGNVVTFDVDAVRTGTHAVNLYIQLYIIPERYFTLT